MHVIVANSHMQFIYLYDPLSLRYIYNIKELSVSLSTIGFFVSARRWWCLLIVLILTVSQVLHFISFHSLSFSVSMCGWGLRTVSFSVSCICLVPLRQLKLRHGESVHCEEFWLRTCLPMTFNFKHQHVSGFRNECYRPWPTWSLPVIVSESLRGFFGSSVILIIQ